MKVLIPYDGTKEAENALLELQNAEFGQRNEILIVMTDVVLLESAEEFSRAVKERRLNGENRELVYTLRRGEGLKMKDFSLAPNSQTVV